MTRIVGIGGKLAAGKDAVADHLVEEYGWVKIGMSDALADALYTLDPWVPTRRNPREFFTRGRFGEGNVERYSRLVDRVGYVKAKENPEVRRLLQVLGTEIGRKMIDEDVWTDMMVKKVQENMAGRPGVIVTGIRFPNEIEAISETLSGELWWVVRPLAEGENARHDSENSVEAADFDEVIRNDGSLWDLYNKVKNLLD